MATLTSTKIKNTYDALLKSIDNDAIGTTAKQITDGLGNVTPLYVSTTQVGIGVTPESGLNLHVFGDAKIGSNLTIIGNLVVEGSTTTVGTDTLTVKDPLIVLANNNTSTDAVDIGFYGKYTPSGTTLYSGLFREALTGKYRLFKGLEDEPTTTVNTSGTGYTKADLVIGDLEATQVDLGDNDKIRLGDSQDLEIYHNGTTGYIVNTRPSGDLYFRNETGSMVFQIQDSGTYASYIILKSTGGIQIDEDTKFTDNVKASFGDSNDLEIYHDGTNASFISNTNTTLPLQIFTDDLDIKSYSLQNNMIIANSGGAVQLYYGGSLKLSTSSTGIQVLGDLTATNGVHLADNVKASFGGSDDLEIYHNGTHSYIDNNTGDIIIRNDAADKGISFLADDGAGGSENYVYIDGGTFETKFYKDTKHLDSVKAFFGTGSDLQIWSTGSNDYISSNFNSLAISSFADNKSVEINTTQAGGSLALIIKAAGTTGEAQLYHLGVLKLKTSSTGVTVTGKISGLTDPSAAQDAATKSYVDTQIGANNELSEVLANGNTTGGNDIVVSANDDITFTDTSKAIFGAGSDLEIYHNGTSASIRNNTGDILISALEADSNIKFYTDNGTGTTVSNLEISGSTGTVSLKYYGSQKLYTTSTGVSITGRISQLTDPSAAQDAATKAYVDLQVGNNNELSEVLANGNTTGGTDIAITAGDDITFTDTSKILMGAGNDLQIYHDGGNSFINDTGTGALLLKSNGSGVYIKTIAGDTQAQFLNDGAVNLYYDNSLKLATTSYGISVTGAINADNYINIEGATNPYLRIQDTTNEEYLNLYSSDNESAIVYTQDTFKISSGIDFLNQTPRLTIDSSGNATFTGDVGVGGASTFTSGTNVEVIDSTIARLGFTNDSTNGHQFAWYAGTTGNAVLYDYTDSVPLLSFTGGNQLFYGKIRVRDNGGTTNIIELNPNGNSYLNGGNVGIGTSSPDYELDVVGSIKASVQSRFANGSASTPAYSFDADSDTGIYRVTTNALGFSTAGTNSLTIDYYKAAFAGDIELNGANKYIYFRTATDSGLWQEYNFSLRFGTNNAERMRIDSSGNVGIGTDNPSNFTGLSFASPILDVAGIIQSKAGNIALGGTSYRKAALMTSTGTDAPYLDLRVAESGTSSSTTTRMRIDSSGRVGIGTDSPAAPLDVNGNVYIRETGVLYVNTLSGYTSNVITLNSNTNFIVPSGNVGIGTTSPDFKLSLNGGMRIENTSPSPNTGSGTEYGYNTSANEAFQITRTKGVGTSTYRPFIHRAEYISFQTGTTSSTERMRITSAGQIQMTKSGADHNLVITNNTAGGDFIKCVGETGDTVFLLDSGGTGGEALLQMYSDGVLKNTISANGHTILNNDGNVGIGTTDPSGYKLKVNGAVSGTNIYANSSGGSFVFGASVSEGDYITRAGGTHNMSFYTNGSEEMRLTSGGDLHVDGDVVAYSTTISDKRLKDNVKPLESSLDKVINLKGVEYVWNNGSRKGQKDIGFIAQEVEEVIPEIVREKQVIFNKEEKYKTVDYEKITAVLVEAVKELTAKVERLENNCK